MTFNQIVLGVNLILGKEIVALIRNIIIKGRAITKNGRKFTKKIEIRILYRMAKKVSRYKKSLKMNQKTVVPVNWSHHSIITSKKHSKNGVNGSKSMIMMIKIMILNLQIIKTKVIQKKRMMIPIQINFINQANQINKIYNLLAINDDHPYTSVFLIYFLNITLYLIY